MRHPVPVRHLVYIGDMCVSFALLESVLRSFIASLINEHQAVGQIICAGLSFKQLTWLLNSLYLERHGKDDEYGRLNELVTKAIQIEETRNLITHSIWAAGKDKEHITRIKTTARERGLKFQFEELSSEDFKNFVNEISECASAFDEFYIKLVRSKKVINNPVDKMW